MKGGVGMKKVLSVLIVFMLVMTMAAPVFADAGEKLKNGAEKFFKSPLQITDNIQSEYEASEFKPFGVFGGFIKGAAHMLIDAGTGLVDVLTFPIDFEKK
jgi:hypothetical protein